MDEEYIMFADLDAMYPGNVVRSAQPVDWSSLLHASIQRQRQHTRKKKQSVSAAVHANSAPQPSVLTKSSDPHAGPIANANASPNSSRLDTLSSSNPEVATSYAASRTSQQPSLSREASVYDKIHTLLSEPIVHLDALKKLSWAGLPSRFRAPAWKLLLGYTPKAAERRHDAIERKRKEYREAVDQHYGFPHTTTMTTTTATSSTATATIGGNLEKDLTPPFKSSAADVYAQHTVHDDVTMRQIAVDIPRTSPGQQMFQIPEVQLALQRVLYVWAMRHPASGYVQGMNDLVTPFMYVFLAEYAEDNGAVADFMHASDLSVLRDVPLALSNAEADSYWCLTALLNDIQDYYTFSQPGIQRRVHFLRELVSRVDGNLCAHLEEQGLDFLQFAFRWMNCLLMRELPFPLIVRVWDTYLAETDGFAVFHVYVCAALLVSFSEELLDMEFQDLVMFLQNLPTQNWSEKSMDIILSQAYLWRTIFGAAPSHLQ